MLEDRGQASQVVTRVDSGAISTLTLTRVGRANAWGSDMADALLAQLRHLAEDNDNRGCVLTGDGEKAFSSGADISSAQAHSTPSAGEYLAQSSLAGHPVFNTLAEFPKPLVCAVNGLAIGAGFLVALHCDVLVAADNAEFAMPQVRLGIIPAYGGMYRLAQWVGRGRATEIGLLGRRVSAAEAHSIGLVGSVCSQDLLQSEAETVAREMATLPPLAVKMAKESLALAYDMAGGRMAALTDLHRFAMLGLTEDNTEAHAAWREHRAPVFQGR